MLEVRLMEKFCRAFVLVILASVHLAGLAGPANPGPDSHVVKADATGYVGNEACARCHSSIYNSYTSTAMGRASGPAKENLIPADFLHTKSGVHYRIYSEGNRIWLSFERPGDPAVRGKRELLYFIGSGRRGLTYLFATDGFVFESPINWYAKAGMWDMTPAYQTAREVPLNLPTYTSCLRCHVSGMQPPLKGTDNHYRMPVFAFSGITCEACHGPGGAHVKGGGIVNPAKLSPDRRDAICMECHLEGKVGIERRGRHAYEFRPGDALSDYIRHYLLVGGSTNQLGAVSEVEALTQSMCKKKTGDAMSCSSCHDPHYSPSAQQRVSYYREKCLACHGGKLGSEHHAEQPDCTTCHMPSILSKDVAHTQVTDHRIPRRPQLSPPQETARSLTSPLRLVPFPYSQEAEHDVRDLALAWESLAETGMDIADEEARRLLRSAIADSPDDAVIVSAFGYLEQRRGAIDHARELYEKALALDPTLIDAATNLGVIEAKSGHWAAAVRFWKDAFQRAPARSGIGMNIVRAFCGAREFDEARSYTLRILEFNPDMGDAKELLRYLNRTPASCAP
jgi:predicted CXXCH cytochrome family protein